jgi:hypothetical protein
MQIYAHDCFPSLIGIPECRVRMSCGKFSSNTTHAAQDPIPRVNKFPAYRRPGKKVLPHHCRCGAAERHQLERSHTLKRVAVRRYLGISDRACHVLRISRRS